MRPGLPPQIARYQRRVAGSLAGVWENVHDWEHLPWLHAGSFRSIALLEAGEWGWRARAGLPPRSHGSEPAGPEIEIELRLRPGAEAYDVTTLAGAGTGSVVATRLAPLGPDETGVDVRFHVPGVGGSSADALGAGYVALYTRLWDEDEAMIVERAKAEASRPGPLRASLRLDLGPRAALGLPHCFELAGRPFQLVELGGTLVAHSATCPHRLGPLPAASTPRGCVVCPWHGHRFDVRTGRSTDGRGERLSRAPVVRIGADGRVEAVLEPGP